MNLNLETSNFFQSEMSQNSRKRLYAYIPQKFEHKNGFPFWGDASFSPILPLFQPASSYARGSINSLHWGYIHSSLNDGNPLNMDT